MGIRDLHFSSNESHPPKRNSDWKTFLECLHLCLSLVLMLGQPSRLIHPVKQQAQWAQNKMVKWQWYVSWAPGNYGKATAHLFKKSLKSSAHISWNTAFSSYPFCYCYEWRPIVRKNERLEIIHLKLKLGLLFMHDCFQPCMSFSNQVTEPNLIFII